MRRLWLCLGIGLVLVCGAVSACRHGPRASLSRESGQSREIAAEPASDGFVAPSSVAKEATPPQLVLPSTEPARTELVTTDEPPARPASEAPAAANSLPSQEAVPGHVVPTTLSGGEPKPKPRAPDSTHPGHAADYGWLVGELHYVHVRDVWCLRYAAPEDDDRYGGRVTLVDPGEMTAYRNGQIVRVEGHFTDPEGHEPSPAYHVRAMRPAP